VKGLDDKRVWHQNVLKIFVRGANGLCRPFSLLPATRGSGDFPEWQRISLERKQLQLCFGSFYMAAVVLQCCSGGFEEVEAVWRGTPRECSEELGGFEGCFSLLGALEKSVSKRKKEKQLKVLNERSNEQDRLLLF